MPEYTDNFFDGLNNLGAVERKLDSALENAELVGSLPITEKDLEKLGCLIRDFFANERMDQVTERFHRRFPNCLAVFMVFEGVHEYQSGNYWGPLCQCLGVEQGTWTNGWRRFFLAFLKEHGFPQFQESSGHKYVTPILAHGGIPDYCLRDFFDHLLWPAIDQMWGDDAQEILADWGNHPSLKKFTDQPVRRFLQRGGSVATDFFERCLEMVYRTQEEDKVPKAQEVGLPERIVVRWQKWFRGRRKVHSQRPKGTRTQFRKPFIAFDPYDSRGIVLNLPEQLLPTATTSDAKPHWSIKSGGKETIVRVDLFRHETSFIKTGKKTHPILPARQYHLQLFTDSELVKQWHLKGMFDHGSALVFDPYNMKLLDPNKLSKQLIWLVYPKNAQLSSDDVVGLPSLPEAWCDYQACEVDLENPLGLQHEGHERRFSYEDPNVRPHFSGGVLAQEASDNEEGIPFYSELPALVIPEEHFSPKGTLVIIPQGVADPAKYKEIQGHELVSIAAKNGREVALSDERLLGKNVVGKFLLHWQWQGHDKKLYLWSVPSLKIDSPKLLVGAQQVQVSIVAPSTTKLELETEAVEVNSSHEADAIIHRLSIDAECTEIKGNLKYPLEAQLCEIPLTIQVPRLRWSIRGLQNQPSIDWQEHPISLTLAELEQANDLYFVFKTTHAVQGLEFQSLVLRGTEQEPMETCKPERGHVPRFYLRKFLRNTIATTQLGKYSIALRLSHPERGRKEILVLQIRRPLKVSNLAVSSKVENDQLLLSISWRGGNHIKGLILRLWNLWKPWQEPWIVDDIDDRNSVERSEPLSERSPGYYRVQFDVNDPWGPKIPRPSGDAPDVSDHKIGSGSWESHLSTLSGVSGVLEHFFANQISQVQPDPPESQLTEITPDEIQQVLKQAHLVEQEYRRKGLCAFHSHLQKRVSPVAFFEAVLRDPKLATKRLLRLLVGIGVAQDPETRLWFLKQAETLDEETKQTFWEWWVPFGLWTELPSEGINHDRLMEFSERYLDVLEDNTDIVLWGTNWRSKHADKHNRIDLRGHEVWYTNRHEETKHFYDKIKEKSIPFPNTFRRDTDSGHGRVHQIAFTIDITVLAQRLIARCFCEEEEGKWSKLGFQVFETFPDLYIFNLCLIEMEYRVFNDFPNVDLKISTYGISMPHLQFKAKQLLQGSSDEFRKVDVSITDLGLVVESKFYPFSKLHRYRWQYLHEDWSTKMWFDFDEKTLFLDEVDSLIRTPLCRYLRCIMLNLIIERI